MTHLRHHVPLLQNIATLKVPKGIELPCRVWCVPSPWQLPPIAGKGGSDAYSRLSHADSIKCVHFCDLALFSRFLPGEFGKGFGMSSPLSISSAYEPQYLRSPSLKTPLST